MIESITHSKSPRYWIIVHLTFGLILSIVPSLFLLWLLASIIMAPGFIGKGSLSNKRVNWVYVITYLSSLSLLARMTSMHKFKIPWEFGKYVVFFGCIYGLLVLTNRKGFLGFFLFLLLIPSMFFSSTGNIIWHDIVFNLLGPFCLALMVLTFGNLKVTKEQFQQVLLLVLYPAITILAYTFIKTPDFESIQFELGAVFDTTGGYGSNQISTILGLGALLSFFFVANKWRLTGSKWGDFGLVALFTFQGLLSFSRGGMIGGIVGVLIFSYLISLSGVKNKKRFSLPNIGKYLIPSVLVVFLMFNLVDNITGGVLSLRYQGETNNSLAGKSEVDLNSITTGRADIFFEDIDVWLDNFVLGAGVGISKLLRPGDIVSHVEFSRLVAEHGLLGLTFIIILIYMGFSLLKRNQNAKYQGVLAALFALAIYTTFHAATRTYISPLLVGISLLSIQGLKEEDKSKNN